MEEAQQQQKNKATTGQQRCCVVPFGGFACGLNGFDFPNFLVEMRGG